MKTDLIEKLETFLQDFDFLFQEGVVFDKEEIETIKSLASQIEDICNDKFLKVKD